MIRTLLAVALAAALLAVALPGVDQARANHSTAVVRADAAALERAATSLVRADETASGPGARRTVALELPSRSWADAGVDAVRIRGAWRSEATAAVAVDLGDRVRTLNVDAPLYTPDGPVVVRGAGRHRVALSLVRVEGRPAVRVRAEASAP